MAEPLPVALFLIAAHVATLLWARALWYFDQRSQVLRRTVLHALGYTRRSASEVRAMLLSAIYYGCGLAASLLFVAVYGLDLGALFSLAVEQPALVALGAVGQISLAALLAGLYAAAVRAGPERFAEVRDTPWMKGLRRLPQALVPWAAAAAAAIEEIFYRGVLIAVMIAELGLAPLAAVAIAGALFCFQQLVQVETAFQAAILGGGSAAIALVGGLLVIHAGSVVPAVLCHAAFVVFFLRRGEERSSVSWAR